MNPEKKSFRAFGILVGSYALLTLIMVLPVDSFFMLDKTSSVFFFCPAVLLTLYFETSIIDRRVRRNLVAIGGLIILWCVLRAAKYVAFEDVEPVARFIWYIYYIPLLMIPQLSLRAALYVGMPEGKKLSRLYIIPGIFTVICILTVLTNDLHQLVFRFNPGFENWNSDYKHVHVFFIIVVWDCLFFFISTAVLFFKCRLSLSRKLTWIPVTYLSLGLFALYLLNRGELPVIWGHTIGEFPEISCYMLGGFWVLCITIGLVPSNKGYGKILQETSLAAIITDHDYRTVYQSGSAIPLSGEQLTSSGQILINDNTVVQRRPVSGGFAYWQTDISDLVQVNRELEQAQKRIAEENELIRHVNELKQRQSVIDSDSRLYDDIAVRVLPQSQKIAHLSAEAKTDPAKFEYNMRIVCICAVYIKRISNMMLLSPSGGIKKSELSLAIYESVRYLNKAGIPSKADCNTDDSVTDAEVLIKLYENFEFILEQALPTLKALFVTLSGDILKLTLEGVSLALPEGIDATAETDDGITFIRLYGRRDGDGK